MRIAAAACALAVLVILAVFGAVLAQRATSTTAASTSTAAVSPSAAEETAPAEAARTVAQSEPVRAVAPEPTRTAAPVVPATQTPPAQAVPASAAPARGATPVPATAALASATPGATPAPQPASARAPAYVQTTTTDSCAGNPKALGVSRVVELDTTGGPGFGFEHFKTHDFLRPGEVVLTFDDGPWPGNTPKVLAALAANCTKATFFPIGKHAMWHPEILRQVAAAGHSIGSHTWSHADLVKLKNPQAAKDEIEKGISAVKWALGTEEAPFFRFPALRHPPEMVTYLGERGIGIFSTDMDSFDFKATKPQQVVTAVLTKLKKMGKGIVLMHDFQHATAEALPTLLSELKANGYKIVFMVPKSRVTTIASYDELIIKDNKLPTLSDRPTSNVVRTISE
jgi:peptidoglycan/xylan/chitin deacetylase (PgdA/CDA1 family)